MLAPRCRRSPIEPSPEIMRGRQTIKYIVKSRSHKVYERQTQDQVILARGECGLKVSQSIYIRMTYY